MRHAHTVEQVRSAEAELMAKLPEGTLMQRAAGGLAVAISNFLGGTYGARVVLLIGSGDNGGDALYAGARLARRGAKVTAVLLSPKVHERGLAALTEAGGRGVSTTGEVSAEISGAVEEEIAAADVVVDGIVGIGGRPGLRPDALAAVRLANDYGVPIVAVDTPSGVDVDTGGIHRQADTRQGRKTPVSGCRPHHANLTEGGHCGCDPVGAAQYRGDVER